MWKRKIPIWESRFLKRYYHACRPALMRTRFHEELPEIPVIEPAAFLDYPPSLSFTAEEEERGFAELQSWGVGRNDWFVCFHARDPAYTGTRTGFGRNEHRSTYFDCSVENLIPAMKWVAEQGGVAIRVGHLVRNALPDLGDRVIDYATKYRSDFMDIFLPAHCRYFVGNTSGLFCVARIFNVPILHTNHCPYPWAGTRIKRNLDIPKLLRRPTDGAILTLGQIDELDLLECHRDESDRLLRIFKPEVYEALGLEWVESSAEDILEACRDMQDMIEGIPMSEDARRARDDFAAFYTRAPDSPQKGGIAPSFAIKYRHLFDRSPTQSKKTCPAQFDLG